MVMIYATGHLSGAHINPAVTVAFTSTRHFPGREALAYIPSQLAGAPLAALLRSPGRERQRTSERLFRASESARPSLRVRA